MDIILDNVNMSFSKTQILTNISLNLTEGEIVGLVGDNGSGKTTIMKIISKLYIPSSGNIHNLPYKNSDLDICPMLEEPEFIQNMTCLENLKYFIKLNIEQDEKFNYYINLFNINFLNKLYKKLSLGMKHKFAILYLFLTDAKLILLDEITNGLDDEFIKKFCVELKKYIVENNKYLLISSHKIKEINNLCDKVYIINDGKIIKYILSNKKENCKKITFKTCKELNEFINECKNIYFHNNEYAIFNYNDDNELKNIITLANKYTINSIEDYISDLEDIYFFRKK